MTRETTIRLNRRAVAAARLTVNLLGQEDAFDALIEGLRAGDLARVEQILDTIVPTPDGVQGTFLPSFAMAATQPFLRSSAAWRRLRDRVFANMDEVERLAQELPADARRRIEIAVAEWRHDHREYSREADPVLQ
jgi:hypothetical protein